MVTVWGPLRLALVRIYKIVLSHFPAVINSCATKLGARLTPKSFKARCRCSFCGKSLIRERHRWLSPFPVTVGAIIDELLGRVRGVGVGLAVPCEVMIDIDVYIIIIYEVMVHPVILLRLHPALSRCCGALPELWLVEWGEVYHIVVLLIFI